MNINITGELPDCVTLHALNGESRTYFERFDRARHMVLVEPELWFRIEQEMTSLRSENAKLRELAVRAYKAARMMCEAWDGPCQNNSDVLSWGVPCPTDERDEQCVFGQLERDMRELGVEVS